MACLLESTSLCLAANEKTDVTAQYLTNASFENDNISALTPENNSADGLRGYKTAAPTGWTVTGTSVTSLIVTKDCYTDNNFGKVTTLANGTQAYYLRQGWSGGNTSVRQSLAALPKGKYQLTASMRTGYANTATSSVNLVAGGNMTTTAFSQGSTGFFTTAPWTTVTLDFEQTADGTATIGFDVTWVSGGSCIMFDDVRLYQLSNETVIPEEPTEADVESPTEGRVLSDFVAEAQMKGDLLQMLANFATYLKNDFQEAQAPNSVSEACGCFKGESTMASNEAGVRTNADLSMICAFLVKYGKGKVTLPAGVTWEKIEDMAMKSLVFAYSTHKANKLKVCSDNKYWGSTSTSDAVWESSLWAMSVAYSAFFQWDKLSDTQKNYIYKLLKAECNYELYRSIPTGYAGDTKAEENGWEADILAATLGLFPNDELAPKWFDRLREFAINSYSQKNDATDNTVIDPDYDQKTVANLYKGQNLYDDYTLQNHNYFHTSYQNVVIQELGEAALALKLFQQGLYNTEKWKTNALMHNNDKVMQEVLYWLALADGELAMPNGNDWSLFLYDQITSYSTMACMAHDADALMLEQRACEMIRHRQLTTPDGSWLLRSDIGARRMGVQAHRVMMTWLMHHVWPTGGMRPSSWADFRQRHAAAHLLPCQRVVCVSTPVSFACFGWSEGLKSYTGYFAPQTPHLRPQNSNLIVPFKANNTGNLLGWYEVEGRRTNAVPAAEPVFLTDGNAWTLHGHLLCNDSALDQRFTIRTLSDRVLEFTDTVRARTDVTIHCEKGGLLAISEDEMTSSQRHYHFGPGRVDIDGVVSVTVCPAKKMQLDDVRNINSVQSALLYTCYDDQPRHYKQGDTIGIRRITYTLLPAEASMPQGR